MAGLRRPGRSVAFGSVPVCALLLAFFFSLSLKAQDTPAAQAAADAGPEAGQVNIKLEKNYARMIFSFARRPGHNVNSSVLNSGVLVLKFDRPVDVNMNGVAERLPTYVTTVRRDPDGKSLRFALARKIWVNTAEAGNDLYVDLLPEPWIGAAPPLPADALAEIMREAEEKERLQKVKAERSGRAIDLGDVKVRTSEAPTFTRLEFLWRDKVPTSLKRDGDRLDIVFDRMGKIDLGQVKVRMPRFVEDISVAEVDARMVVSMKVDTMRDVRLFEEGNAVYVDIQGPPRGAKELQANGDVTVSPSSDLAIGGPGTLLAGQEPQNPQTQSQTQAAATPTQGFGLSTSGQATQMNPEGAENKAQPQAPLLIRPKPDESSGTVTPETSTLENGNARMVLSFADETAAAIFQRGRTLWMIFETGQKIDTKPIAALFERKLRHMNIDYKDKLAILRLDLEVQPMVSATTLDTSWLITLGETVTDKSDPAELKSHIAPDGRSVVNGYMNRAVSVNKIHDSVVGDDLTVVLAMGPPIGLVKSQSFIDFTALATIQGAALLPHVDDLDVRLDDIGFVVERPGSMAVSVAAAPRSTELSSSQQLQSTFGYIDFEGWKLGPPDEFNKIKQTLTTRAAMSEGTARNAARLDLARFYIAYQLGPEAASMLNLVARDDPATERELSFRIVRGVANVMARHFDAAERDLSDPLLDDNPDISIWRGFAAIERKDWKFARRYLEKAQSVMTNYPRSLQAKILLQLARATIELNDLVNTDGMLDEASNLVSRERGNASVALMRARFNEAVGRYDAAIHFYKQAEGFNQRQVSAESVLRRVTLQEKLGQMPQDEAIKQLEALSFTWRGDDIELEAYQRLGDYLAKSDKFRQAFTVMRSASLANPDLGNLARALRRNARRFHLALSRRQERRYAGAGSAIPVLRFPRTDAGRQTRRRYHPWSCRAPCRRRSSRSRHRSSGAPGRPPPQRHAACRSWYRACPHLSDESRTAEGAVRSAPHAPGDDACRARKKAHAVRGARPCRHRAAGTRNRAAARK